METGLCQDPPSVAISQLQEHTETLRIFTQIFLRAIDTRRPIAEVFVSYQAQTREIDVSAYLGGYGAQHTHTEPDFFLACRVDGPPAETLAAARRLLEELESFLRSARLLAQRKGAP